MGAFTSALGMAGGGNFITSAFVGGVVSSLQGGEYGSGFLSAGVVALAVPAINSSIGNGAGRVAARAIVGGTVTHITGGKFANGAAMAAFQGALQEIGEFTGSGSGAAKRNIDPDDPQVIAANARLDAAMKNKGIAKAGFVTRKEARLAAANQYASDAYVTGREANWAVLELSDGTFGYSSPRVGAMGEISVGLYKKRFYLSMKSGGVSVVGIDSIGHNHLMGDFNLSYSDYDLVNNPLSSHRGSEVWLWNELGKATSLRGDLSIKSYGLPKTVDGIRQKEYDIPVSW